MFSPDEELLNTLYAKRQDLFKQLSEVDQSIRNQEILIEQRKCSNNQFLVEECLNGSEESGNKLSQFIARSTVDINGLRDALRIVDACKCISDSEDAQNATKMRVRDELVREVISHSVRLAQNTLGSDLMIRVIGILRSGGAAADVCPDLPQKNAAAFSRESEFLLLIRQIGDSMPMVCCDTCGARVVQKLLDNLLTVEELSAFTDTVAGSIVELAKDINGNHSIAKVMAKLSRRIEKDGEEPLHRVESEEIQRSIYSRLSEQCTVICTNRQGCCIIQKCIVLAPNPYKEVFIEKILSSALKLVQDPFGNYVIQHILDKEDGKGSESGEYTNQIIRQMLHHISELSCNKFGSNVVEKCLKNTACDVRQLIMDELTDPQVLPKLLTDSFANYVIQTALSTANDQQHNQLREAIAPHQELLKNSPYGVKIEAKLTKRHREIIRKQTAGKKGSSFSKSTTNSGSCHRSSGFSTDNQFSNNKYPNNQNYAPVSMSNPDPFMPRMAFPTLDPGDSSPQVMHNYFAPNVQTDMPMYSPAVPVILNGQSMIAFNQHAEILPPGDSQAPYTPINVVQGSTMSMHYNSR